MLLVGVPALCIAGLAQQSASQDVSRQRFLATWTRPRLQACFLIGFGFRLFRLLCLGTSSVPVLTPVGNLFFMAGLDNVVLINFRVAK